MARRRLLLVLPLVLWLIPSVTTLADEDYNLLKLLQYYEDVARLRVVHASPDTSEVNVVVDGVVVANNLAFKGVSDYISLPGGSHTVAIFPVAGGASLISTSLNMLTRS